MSEPNPQFARTTTSELKLVTQCTKIEVGLAYANMAAEKINPTAELLQVDIRDGGLGATWEITSIYSVRWP